jgi:hypothetical protein
MLNKRTKLNNYLTTGTGYGSGSKITLTTNTLTTFPSTVFQSVLEGMAASGNNLTTYIDIAGSNHK